MSTPSEPTLTTDVEFPRDSQAGESKSSTGTTGAADNAGKDQHDVPKSGTVEQDTAVDDGLQGSLDAKIASEGHPATTADRSSPATNVGPGADLSVPEINASSQGADDGDIWIPKGGHDKPNGTPVKPGKPTRPKRDN